MFNQILAQEPLWSRLRQRKRKPPNTLSTSFLPITMIAHHKTTVKRTAAFYPSRNLAATGFYRGAIGTSATSLDGGPPSPVKHHYSCSAPRAIDTRSYRG
jgi:hypothetical protein